MERLKAYIASEEDWLVKQILRYAREQGYTMYTPTLEAAWRISISGLSRSLIQAIDDDDTDLEFGPDHDFVNDPAAEFGIIEARNHRARGIKLSMFLGLMKYYRQAYRDLVHRGEFSTPATNRYLHVVERCFDRIEIAFCVEWTSLAEEGQLDELRTTNRAMTNEKNRYLTVFESLSNPILLLDEHNRIVNMNQPACRKFAGREVPGSLYYEGNGSREHAGPGDGSSHTLDRLLPWLVSDVKDFDSGSARQRTFERTVSMARGQRDFQVRLSRMLDVTSRYTGTVVELDDITARKRLEVELEKLATTDALTGASNRYQFWQLARREIKRARRYRRPLSLLLLDINFFKFINDRYGHHAGDQVLEALVVETRTLLRGSDVLGRLGGEEFGIILVETSVEAAAKVAERLRIRLSCLGVEVDEQKIHFSVSIGLTEMCSDDEKVEQLLRRADGALYRAKNLGRDCVMEA